MHIGERRIGDGEPCYFVAEIGLNHNGDINIAKSLVDVAVKAGADAVKMQKRNIDCLIIKEWRDKPYTGDNSFGKTYGEHRQNLELSDDDWYEMARYCKERSITFLASGWDIESVAFIDKLGVPAFKVASADVTNIPLLTFISYLEKPVILSTGMSTLEEIDEAVEIFDDADIEYMLLHCVSAYPVDYHDVNLRNICALKIYGVPIGYSGHEKSGHVVTLGAVAMGASLVERHITLDHTMKGPDHAASLEPGGLTSLIASIRNLELAMGSKEKKILPIEIPSREKLAKSIVSTRDIKKGDIINAADITVKSPGIGLKPKYITNIIGRIVQKTIPEDTLIPKEALKWKWRK
jgi:sialic acid synthase SpsE